MPNNSMTWYFWDAPRDSIEIPSRVLENAKSADFSTDNVLSRNEANDELVVRRKKTIVTRMRDYLKNLCSTDSLNNITPFVMGFQSAKKNFLKKQRFLKDIEFGVK